MLDDLNGKFKKYADNGEMRLMAIYSEREEDGVAFQEQIQKYFPNIPFLPCNPMSLSVCCHTSPNSVALCCIRVAVDL